MCNTHSRDGWDLKARNPSSKLNFEFKYFNRICKTIKMRNQPSSLQRTQHSVSIWLFQKSWSWYVCVSVFFFPCLDFKCFATQGHSWTLPTASQPLKGACQAKASYVWKVGHQEASVGHTTHWRQHKVLISIHGYDSKGSKYFGTKESLKCIMEINLSAVFLWINGHVNNLLAQTPISSST